MSSKITLKSPKEIEILKEGGLILASILEKLRTMLVPGAKGEDLDRKAKEMAKKYHAYCSFYQYEGFPAHICMSKNDEIVHGIPFEKKINEGDIVGIDAGIKYKGLFTDSAFTHFVPYKNEFEAIERQKEIDKKNRLIETTFLALKKTLNECRAGSRIGDIGFIVESLAKSRGYSVVKCLVGHGVGHAVHEDPMVPNYGKRGEGMRLNPGMVIAIEPMLNVGSEEAILDSRDQWTFRTSDGSLSAHFEWTVAITEKEPIILTPLDWV